MLEREIRRLLERGIQPRRITILSAPPPPENSCLAGVDSLAGCPLAEVRGPQVRRPALSTIRAFKGARNPM